MTTEEAFNTVKAVVVATDPSLRTIQLVRCGLIEQDHVDSPRVFCHVFHKPTCICCAFDFEYLDDPFQLGIFLHEFGHLGAASEIEEDADIWVADNLGITIKYRFTIEWVPLAAVLDAYERAALAR